MGESVRSPRAPAAVRQFKKDVTEVVFSIHVKRHYGFYVWKVFLPLLLMVFLSWAVFWVDPFDLSNQVQIAVTTILTVIAFAFAISATMPRVPYITFIDAFFLTCYVFVFIAVVELMTVHTTHRRQRARGQQAHPSRLAMVGPGRLLHDPRHSVLRFPFDSNRAAPDEITGVSRAGLAR